MSAENITHSQFFQNLREFFENCAHASASVPPPSPDRFLVQPEMLKALATHDFGGGENLLHAAISAKQFGIAAIAATVPQCLNGKDAMGYTPLLHAINRGQFQMALYLAKQAETDVTATNHGSNALHYLAAKKIPEDDLSAYAKTHVIADGENACSATMRAISQKKLVQPLVTELLKTLDPLARNREGKTPTDIARGKGFNGLARMLDYSVQSVNSANPALEAERMWNTRIDQFLTSYESAQPRLQQSKSAAQFIALLNEGSTNGWLTRDALQRVYDTARTGSGDDGRGNMRSYHTLIAELDSFARSNNLQINVKSGASR